MKRYTCRDKYLFVRSLTRLAFKALVCNGEDAVRRLPLKSDAVAVLKSESRSADGASLGESHASFGIGLESGGAALHQIGRLESNTLARTTGGALAAEVRRAHLLRRHALSSVAEADISLSVALWDRGLSVSDHAVLAAQGAFVAGEDQSSRGDTSASLLDADCGLGRLDDDLGLLHNSNLFARWELLGSSWDGGQCCSNAVHRSRCYLLNGLDDGRLLNDGRLLLDDRDLLDNRNLLDDRLLLNHGHLLSDDGGRDHVSSLMIFDVSKSATVHVLVVMTVLGSGDGNGLRRNSRLLEAHGLGQAGGVQCLVRAVVDFLL